MFRKTTNARHKQQIAAYPPPHVSQEREEVVRDCPVTDKEPESLDQ